MTEYSIILTLLYMIIIWRVCRCCRAEHTTRRALHRRHCWRSCRCSCRRGSRRRFWRRRKRSTRRKCRALRWCERKMFRSDLVRLSRGRRRRYVISFYHMTQYSTKSFTNLMLLLIDIIRSGLELPHSMKRRKARERRRSVRT